MKHDCDIVRDLMPLVMDGTASDKSCAVVQEHVSECAPCREMLEEMRQEVSAEPSSAQAERLVRKLRNRRRLRSVILVLLGVLVSVMLLVAGWRGWNYYYNDFRVLTAEKDYAIEVVRHDACNAQVILTMLDAHAQVLNSWLDEESGDLYIWSTTTRRPRSVQSVWSVARPADFYFFDDIGYAMRYAVYDEETEERYDDVMPINRILKGAPEWFSGADGYATVMSEQLNWPDDALVGTWRERLGKWGIELNPAPEAE